MQVLLYTRHTHTLLENNQSKAVSSLSLSLSHLRGVCKTRKVTKNYFTKLGANTKETSHTEYSKQGTNNNSIPL